jgi:trehalose/maltose hydrolase-like predicted phosphorylase
VRPRAVSAMAHTPATWQARRREHRAPQHPYSPTSQGNGGLGLRGCRTEPGRYRSVRTVYIAAIWRVVHRRVCGAHTDGTPGPNWV